MHVCKTHTLRDIHTDTHTLTGSVLFIGTGPDGAVAMSSACGLIGTGFTSQYQLQPRVGF